MGSSAPTGAAMKRSGELRRSTPMARGGKLERSPMKKRKPSAAEQERKYGTPERRAWFKQRPCIICGRMPSDMAHVQSGGTGKKDHHRRTVPLCSTIVATGYVGHHAEYDGGKASFLAKHGLTVDDLLDLAEWTESLWQHHRASNDPGHYVTCDPAVHPELVG